MRGCHCRCISCIARWPSKRAAISPDLLSSLSLRHFHLTTTPYSLRSQSVCFTYVASVGRVVQSHSASYVDHLSRVLALVSSSFPRSFRTSPLNACTDSIAAWRKRSTRRRHSVTTWSHPRRISFTGD